MKKTSTLVTLLIFFQITFAQQSRFSKVYFDNAGSFSADAMVRSFDGGLIVAGLYNYSSSSVLKIDSLGVIQWSKTIGTGLNEAYNSVVRTTDSCYVMAGKTYDAVSGMLDIQIVKIDQSGGLVWAKTIPETGHQEALSLSTTFDGGFVLTGFGSFLSTPNTNIIVAKLDSNGDIEWYNTIESGNITNIGTSIKQTPDSGFVLTGYSENFGLLLKLSPAGTIEWSNKYTQTSAVGTYGSDLVILPDGIATYFTTNNDFVVVKTDFSGMDQWKNSYSGIPAFDGCHSCVTSKMKLLSNGNLVFATGSRSMAIYSYVVAVDSIGDFRWSQGISNSVHDVEEADDHGLFFLGNGPLIGVRTTTITNPHIGIVKSDSLGNADDCTYVNPSLTVTFGTVTQAAVALTAISHVISSSAFSPTEGNFILNEMTGCVDVIGGVDDNLLESIVVFPNPNQSAFSIKLPGVVGPITIEVSDITGKIVFVKKINLSGMDELKMDYQLTSGFYNLTILKDEKRVVKKIIID